MKEDGRAKVVASIPHVHLSGASVPECQNEGTLRARGASKAAPFVVCVFVRFRFCFRSTS